MSKASDKLVLEAEPAKSYAGVATRTRSKGKAVITELEGPETITTKEVDLKLSPFMDKMNAFR